MVNERLECVYHTLVKPVLPVTDYLTKYSGVTGKMLNNVQTTLKDVQRDLQNLLPDDAILVGQAIGGDLIALEVLVALGFDFKSFQSNSFPVEEAKISLEGFQYQLKIS